LISAPIIKSNLEDLECKVFELALEGVCNGSVDHIFKMDIDTFNKLYSYYIAKKEIAVAWQNIALHQQKEDNKRNK
jgi:hypothetical protein